MNYKVIIHKRALRYLENLPVIKKKRIKQSLKKLENGIDNKTDIKRMAGEWKGYYRMRVGDVRIIFWVDYELKTIYVDHTGPRGDIYKKK